MPEKRESFQHGSSTFDGYYGWMNERHAIYCRRVVGKPWPWTDDPILREYKFTNVFRELDWGTICLRLMEEGQTDPGLIFWNTVWYRIFNWWELAFDIGFCESWEQLNDEIKARHKRGERLFTGAHMVRGTTGGEPKHLGYLRLLKSIWDKREQEARAILAGGTMENAHSIAMAIPFIGDFTAYEIVCDLRWSLPGFVASDKLTWGNVGNGAARGLKRLGMPPTVDSMRLLFDFRRKRLRFEGIEMREIEHCLCEFDKYERARLGQGKPRSKYHVRLFTE